MRFDEKLPIILKLKAILSTKIAGELKFICDFIDTLTPFSYKRTSLDMDRTLDFDPFILMEDLITLIILGPKSVCNGSMCNLSKNGND